MLTMNEMFRDSLQERLQEMEIESPSPSLESVEPTSNKRLDFLAGYSSRAVEQVPQRSFVGAKTLRDVLYDSRTAWIELFAKDFAEEEGRNIQAKHYKKAIVKLDYAFLVNESDIGLKNLFETLKMIAYRGQMSRDSFCNRDVFYGVCKDGRNYSVECQTKIGGDEVSVNIGDISFGISDESFLNSGRARGGNKLAHYGSKIPKDILTQVLNGRIDGKRRVGKEIDYTPSGPSHFYDEREALKMAGGSALLGGMFFGPLGFILGAVLGREKYDREFKRNKQQKIERDMEDARHGRGVLAGKTGNPFIDDPFFNPRAPGGKWH